MNLLTYYRQYYPQDLSRLVTNGDDLLHPGRMLQPRSLRQPYDLSDERWQCLLLCIAAEVLLAQYIHSCYRDRFVKWYRTYGRFTWVGDCPSGCSYHPHPRLIIEAVRPNNIESVEPAIQALWADLGAEVTVRQEVMEVWRSQHMSAS